MHWEGSQHINQQILEKHNFNNYCIEHIQVLYKNQLFNNVVLEHIFNPQTSF